MTVMIGICDDQPEQIQLLRQYLNSSQNAGEFVIVESTEPQDFLEKLAESKPQLVFLDIDMNGTDGMDGIRLGEAIRSLNEDAVVVYVTAHEEYALEAFRVRAFHYLLKPLTKEKFNPVLEEAFKTIQRNQAAKPEKCFNLQMKGELVSLNCSQIYYFEKSGHRIRIHTKTGDVYYYGNLSGLPGKFDDGSFLQCHQGYVVNTDKIRSFKEKTLFLEGGFQLPVSRSFAENVRETLVKKLFAGKEEVV